jgi:formiminoglutamase
MAKSSWKDPSEGHSTPLQYPMSAWSGRVDAADAATSRRWHQVVQPLDKADCAGHVLLGFASDEGVRRNQGRTGAAEGPRALRRALSNLAWHANETARLYDAGDVACQNQDLEAAQGEYTRLLARLLASGHQPIGLGGGHEIAWAAYCGLEQALQDDARLKGLGIINFDAHLDLRAPDAQGNGTSGTPFLQIAQARAARSQPFRYMCIGANESSNTRTLIDRAAALKAEIVFDVDTGSTEHAAVERRIARFIAESTGIYLTFCLDVLPAAVAPGVSAPSGLGVEAGRAIALLRTVLHHCSDDAGSGKLLIADVAEMNPAHDPDGRTARIAARIVYEILASSPLRRAP